MNIVTSFHRKHYKIQFFIMLVFVGFWQGAHTATAQSGINDRQRPSRAELEQAIERATGYLERACGPDGKFAYKVDVATGRERSSYDIIRHEGAIYALAMANQTNSDPRTAETLTRAATFLRQNYIGPGVRPDQLVVWSKLLATAPDRQYAELGGAGLGLVALTAMRQVDPKLVPISDLQALGRFVLFLQRDDGGFVDKYGQIGGPVAGWESLYYPGEAVLGLVALYEADRSSQWLVAAAKALSHLAKIRIGASTVPADHWALIATAKLLPYIDQVPTVVSRDELVQHAIQICNSIIRDQFKGSAPMGLDGAFDPDGRTAPAATRLEGLLAALEFLPAGELREKVERSADRGIAFLLRAQIVSGTHVGGLPGSIITRARDSSAIRIDYVQHALCAWLRYQKILNRKT